MNMQTQYKYGFIILLAGFTAIAVFQATDSKTTIQPIAYAEATSPHVAGASTESINANTKSEPKLLMPISVGLDRVTKKPFGLKVSPETSPVENDIFYGYHTGIDFEVFPGEENTDVVITAACDGKVLFREWAKGYGGVLVQACRIDGEDMTIIYGHMKLENMAVNAGQTLEAGDKIGVLGEGYTEETDLRRKHLHFDIHKGTQIDIHGYVSNQEDLDNWIDPISLLE